MADKHIEIELLSNHWISFEDDEQDLCAHGQVRVGNEVIVDQGEKNAFWATTAMSIHLLRTLERNHVPDNLVGEFLIPCCGHHFDHLKDSEEVYIQGCFTGHNFWVEHIEDKVVISTDNDSKVEVSFDEYKDEVIKFSDGVLSLYETSKPKKLPDNEYDRTGYELMWREWQNRRQKWD